MTADPSPRDPTRSAITLAAAALFVVLALRMGWVSDDAFIAFRAASNLVTGFGLTSNPGERVQAFTSPLFTLLVAAAFAIVRDIYLVAVGLGLFCTLGVALVLTLRRGGALGSPLALVLLASSHSVLSFSTSGLENPLAHLLIVTLVVERLRPEPSLWRSMVLAGLIALSRLDHLLLVAPVLLWDLTRACRRREWRRFGWPLAVGLSPLVSWLSFAIVYYGFPFPNTAYAKLNLAIPRSTMILQGITYLVDAALRDPLSIIVIALCGVFAWQLRRRHPVAPWLAAGVLIYVGYVVWIGGDFMGGRFLTTPYVVAAVLVAERLALGGAVPVGAAAAVALLAGRAGLDPMPVDVRPGCVVPPSGIVDERACYVEHTGIAQNLRKKKYMTHPYYKKGDSFRKETGPIVNNLIGMAGFSAGPTVHVLDEFALSDPLLARIRFVAPGDFRIGHFRRSLPAGYLESLRSGENRIEDACVHRLWDELRTVIAGPIFSRRRFATILSLNFGRGTCPAPAR